MRSLSLDWCILCIYIHWPRRNLSLNEWCFAAIEDTATNLHNSLYRSSCRSISSYIWCVITNNCHTRRPNTSARSQRYLFIIISGSCRLYDYIETCERELFKSPFYAKLKWINCRAAASHANTLWSCCAANNFTHTFTNTKKVGSF